MVVHLNHVANYLRISIWIQYLPDSTSLTLFSRNVSRLRQQQPTTSISYGTIETLLLSYQSKSQCETAQNQCLQQFLQGYNKTSVHKNSLTHKKNVSILRFKMLVKDSYQVLSIGTKRDEWPVEIPKTTPYSKT